MQYVLSMFTESLFAVVQSKNLANSELQTCSALDSLQRKTIVRSSANKMEEKRSEILGNSLMNNKNNKQLKLDPCGVPTVTGRAEEMVLEMRTDWDLLVK